MSPDWAKPQGESPRPLGASSLAQTHHQMGCVRERSAQMEPSLSLLRKGATLAGLGDMGRLETEEKAVSHPLVCTSRSFGSLESGLCNPGSARLGWCW